MQQLLPSTIMPQLTYTRTITMQNPKKSSKMGITACYFFFKRKNVQYSACRALFCSGQFGWWEIAGAVFYVLNPLVDFMGGALQFVHTLHEINAVRLSLVPSMHLFVVFVLLSWLCVAGCYMCMQGILHETNNGNEKKSAAKDSVCCPLGLPRVSFRGAYACTMQQCMCMKFAFFFSVYILISRCSVTVVSPPRLVWSAGRCCFWWPPS